MKKKIIYGAVAILLIFIVVIGFSSCSCNRESYDDAVRLGQEALSQGDYENATYHLKRASQLSPEDYTILINLGMAHYKAEEYSAAANVFEKAVLVNPTEEAMEALAVVRLTQKLYDDAVKVYTKAIVEYGRKSNLVAGLAACHIRMGNVKYASELLMEAYNDNPKDPIALYNLATLKADTEKVVEAANYFVSFFECVDPVENKEQLEEARRRFAELTAKYPKENKNLAKEHYRKAKSFYRKKDYVSSFQEALFASRKDPTEPSYIYTLIIISDLVNRPENKKRLLTRLQNGFPEYEHLDKVSK